MAFLHIAGIEVDVSEFSEQTPEVAGVEDYSWNNTYRVDVWATSRRWAGVVADMPLADYETLRAAVLLGEVPAYGDALSGTSVGSPLTVRVLVGAGEYHRNGDSFVVTMGFDMIAVLPE